MVEQLDCLSRENWIEQCMNMPNITSLSLNETKNMIWLKDEGHDLIWEDYDLYTYKRGCLVKIFKHAAFHDNLEELTLPSLCCKELMKSLNSEFYPKLKKLTILDSDIQTIVLLYTIENKGSYSSSTLFSGLNQLEYLDIYNISLTLDLSIIIISSFPRLKILRATLDNDNSNVLDIFQPIKGLELNLNLIFKNQEHSNTTLERLVKFQSQLKHQLVLDINILDDFKLQPELWKMLLNPLRYSINSFRVENVIECVDSFPLTRWKEAAQNWINLRKLYLTFDPNYPSFRVEHIRTMKEFSSLDSIEFHNVQWPKDNGYYYTTLNANPNQFNSRKLYPHYSFSSSSSSIINK